MCLQHWASSISRPQCHPNLSCPICDGWVCAQQTGLVLPVLLPARIARSAMPPKKTLIASPIQLCATPRSPCQVFGPNFVTLGLIDVPWEEIYEGLQISSTTAILVEPWDSSFTQVSHYWTDGSVVCAKDPFAVIDEFGNVVSSGKLHHWCLSSYTAELYVILAASERPCIIHTDSLTVVQEYQRLSQLQELPASLHLRAWWKFLFDLIASRSNGDMLVLHLKWCPAHSWDHLPCEFVTGEMLASKSLTRQDLWLNRKADLVAKEHLANYNYVASSSATVESCALYSVTTCGLQTSMHFSLKTFLLLLIKVGLGCVGGELCYLEATSHHTRALSTRRIGALQLSGFPSSSGLSILLLRHPSWSLLLRPLRWSPLCPS